MYIDPSGFYFGEYYLYSHKQWEMAPIGVSYYDLASGVCQNAPVIVTSSGYIESNQSDPWARIDGLGKYTKVGYGDFTIHPDGTSDTSRKEFSLHPDSSGQIIFSVPLTENVFIEYETGPSGYYIDESVDINPIRNQVKSGFVHFSQSTIPISIVLSPLVSYVYADGHNFVRLTAQALDNNYDPAANQKISFSLPDGFLGNLSPVTGVVSQVDPSGFAIQIDTITNAAGEAKVKYIPKNIQSGTQVVSAYLTDIPSILNHAFVIQQYTVSNSFTLDVSFLDSSDYLV